MRHLALWLISTLTLSCTQLSLKTLQNHPAPRHPAMQARQDTTVAIGEFIDARPTFTLSNAQSRRINESGPTAASIYQKALYGVDGDELRAPRLMSTRSMRSSSYREPRARSRATDLPMRITSENRRAVDVFRKLRCMEEQLA